MMEEVNSKSIKENTEKTVRKDKKTVVVKIKPSYIKKNLLKSKVNKVYVAPNKASKETVLKKLNDPQAEIIEVSTIYDPSKGYKIKAEEFEEPVQECSKVAIENSRKVNINFQDQDDQGINSIIHVAPTQKGDEVDVTEHEILDIQEEVQAQQNSKYCDFSDEEEEYEENESSKENLKSQLEDIMSKQNNLSWMNMRPTKDLEERIKLAIEAVLKSNMSVKRAAHVFGIRYNLLVNKINKAGSTCKGVLGADPALTEKEELQLVEWIRTRYKTGCPVKKIDLISRVADIVSDGRPTRFKDGTPGEKWFMNFMNRNPSVAILGPATRCDSREIPSKQSILAWFNRCEEHLEAFGQEHLLQDARRVGSIEEVTLCLLSAKTKVSKPNGSREGMLYLPQEKSGNIMVLLGGCGDGTSTPPMPVFSCKKPPGALINSIPSGWGIGLSKDGNINKEVVHSYFKNIFIPWLTDQERLPFILFVDKLKNFLAIETADFCAQKGLLIYNFHPNSSLVLQPLYKSVIEPIKKSWGALSTHRNDKDALIQFCPTLNKILEELATPYVITKSFSACGIYPFDSKAPDYSKCVLIKDGHHNKNFTSNDYAIALEIFEDTIGQVKTEIFQESLKGFKLLKSDDAPLFKVWHQIISKVDITKNSLDQDEYRHEKIIRGASRKLPRPEMYLMVVDEDEERSSLQDVRNFNRMANNSSILEADIDNPPSETELEIDIHEISKDGGRISINAGKGGKTEKSSAFWKDTYRTAGMRGPPKGKKVREKKLNIKVKREVESLDILEDDSVTKRLRKAIGPRYCSHCLEDKGKLIKCMVCKNHIHFECMMEEEQQILSDLYQDQVAFDYICPSCS